MKIGDRCFTQGCIGEIVGQDGPDCWTIMVTQPIVIDMLGLKAFAKSNKIYSINKVKVEPVCSDVFPLGTSVGAIQSGNQGFTGIVTGYEAENNRVVCLSDRHVETGSETRQRYAYRVNELAGPAEYIGFELNHKYQVPNGKVYRTIEIPREDKMMLIDDATGKFVAYVLPLTKTEWLKERQLAGIRDMSKANYRG